MLRMPFDEIAKVLQEKLEKRNCPTDQAKLVAHVMTENALEGIYSHGVNRFAGLIRSIEKDEVCVNTSPEKAAAFGGLESYDGKRGLGILNGLFCMDRAIELAKLHGVGYVAIRNTSHWLRAATYGYRACNAGMAGICFTNTEPVMPTWGGGDARLGNNPIVFAFPRDGGHLVCDMAMSQFSYGALEVAMLENRRMPFDAGWTDEGELTKDPSKVYNAGRLHRHLLPAGLWKGAAMAHMLDTFAGVIPLGNTTQAIDKTGGNIDVSQTFIAINYRAIAPKEQSDELIEKSLEFLLASTKLREGEIIPHTNTDYIIYTGQLAVEARQRNLAEGIPVHEDVWKEVLAL